MKKKIELVNGAILLLCILLVAAGAAVTIYKINAIDHNMYDNEFRVEVSLDLQKIREGNYEPCQYSYIVVNLNKEVVVSTKEGFQKGEKVNLDEMNSYDKYYAESTTEYKKCFSIEKNQKLAGFVVFFVPQDKFVQQDIEKETKMACIPLIVGIAASIIITIAYIVYARRNIYQPIREISQSSRAIINGNYDIEVVRVYGEKLKQNEVGDLIYSFELMRDELKEKQIKENELKLANKELICAISHDLRTPLATIKAYAEGIRDGIAPTKEARMEYVAVILNKTNLLVTMIKELLEYSNAQARKMEINRKECYLYEYIKPVLKELNIFIKKKHLQVEIRLEASDALISIDQKRITEVLYNLVENSMKYIDKDPGKIKIVISNKEDAILVQVIDNGMGIDGNDILYVFDKFYRAEKSRTSSIPGSGLGLSICQYIIREHGGEIYCKSHVGEGCEIGFTIPLL